MKRNFELGQETSCCIRHSDGHPYKRQLEGLRDARRIVKELQKMGYKVKKDDIMLYYPGYSKVTLKEAKANKFDGEKPSGYRIKGDDITLDIRNFSKSRMPDMIGGPTRWGVEGSISIYSPERENFEDIIKMMRDYFTVRYPSREGRKELLEILYDEEKNYKWINDFRKSLGLESTTLIPPFPDPEKQIKLVSPFNHNEFI